MRQKEQAVVLVPRITPTRELQGKNAATEWKACLASSGATPKPICAVKMQRVHEATRKLTLRRGVRRGISAECEDQAAADHTTVESEASQMTRGTALRAAVSKAAMGPPCRDAQAHEEAFETPKAKPKRMPMRSSIKLGLRAKEKRAPGVVSKSGMLPRPKPPMLPPPSHVLLQQAEPPPPPPEWSSEPPAQVPKLQPREPHTPPPAFPPGIKKWELLSPPPAPPPALQPRELFTPPPEPQRHRMQEEPFPHHREWPYEEHLT